MRYDPESRHRRSVRLKGYDYACAGAYFVTICTQDRACLFGEIENGKMLLNDAGRMVQSVWNELPVYYAGIETDAFIIMPNHIHGVKQSGWPPFRSRLWQRNYWEHIVRNEQDLMCLREYIRFNPKKWALDALMVAH